MRRMRKLPELEFVYDSSHSLGMNCSTTGRQEQQEEVPAYRQRQAGLPPQQENGLVSRQRWAKTHINVFHVTVTS